MTAIMEYFIKSTFENIPTVRCIMPDQFSEYYAEYLDGSYDCIDRIVLNAYFPLIQSGGGFRVWWRQLCGSDDTLDTTHLMRFAGHFSRRIQAFTKKSKIPLVFCEAVMDALVALAIHPLGITTGLLAKKGREITGVNDYSVQQAAYDLKKFRSKGIVISIAAGKYEATPQGLRTMAAYLTLMDHVLVPLLNRAGKNKRGRKPANQTEKDRIYDTLQNNMSMLFNELRLAA